MKCTECPDYRKCSKQNDLRRLRGRCPKAKKQKIPTNGDRIRAMNDEELAAILYGMNELDERIHFCQSLPECEKFFEDGEDIPEHKCRDCLLKWLQQPAKEE